MAAVASTFDTKVDGFVVRDEKERDAVIALRERLMDLAAEQDETHNLGDSTLVRCLRARRHKLSASEKVYRKTAAWRKETNPRHLAQTFDAAEVIRKYRPGGFLGRDFDGRPVFYDRIANVDIGIIKYCTAQELTDFEVQKQEVITEVFKTCSADAGHEIYQMTIVQDLKGLHLGQLTRDTLKIIEAVLGVLDSYFYQRFVVLLIINPPFVFSAAWNLVKYFVHETTREQVKVISGNPLKTLSKYIDPAQIPEAYGGQLRIDGDPYCSKVIVPGGPIPKNFKGEPSVYRDEATGIPVHLFIPAAPRSSVKMEKSDVDAALAEQEEAEAPETLADMFARTVTLVTEWVRDVTAFQLPRPDPDPAIEDEEDAKSRRSSRFSFRSGGAAPGDATRASKCTCCVIS